MICLGYIGNSILVTINVIHVNQYQLINYTETLFPECWEKLPMLLGDNREIAQVASSFFFMFLADRSSVSTRAYYVLAIFLVMH